jgi:hypothetical protein
MTVIASQIVNPQYIKMRWEEPYVSGGLNSKAFKVLPRGVYRGFDVVPGSSDKEVVVNPAAIGSVSGYASGNYDAASGWSVAVHEADNGYTTTVAIQSGASGSFIFDLTSSAGQTVYLALDVNYQLGYGTQANVRAVDAAELDAKPTLLVLARVNVPLLGAISQPNIILNDTQYPRILPYANSVHDGFMSASQAEILEILENPNVSNAFEDETIVSVPGIQIISLPPLQQYVVGGYDLWVFKNGVKMFRGRDYTEIDDGGGFGTTVQWLSALSANDRITFRTQEYAVSLANNLSILDENTLIGTGVTKVNFKGNGVLAQYVGGGQTDVTIPNPSAVASTVRQKRNITGSSIPAYRAVHLLADGTITLCDPTNPVHKFFGMTTAIVPNTTFGGIVLDGVAALAITGLGFAVGDDVFISHAGDGTLTNVPPDPLDGKVLRVGIADCTDNSASSLAVDIVFDRGRLS